ncbi:MAG: 23S rRNA (adenine(2503)-C(2))-methyltransferase RlmN [Treponema sp.]|jgi:23S rRNA (adenine2503-C2)-methyltransferase|nr:23S rRNA (adenine(2503)-C(2))-methyltransferase RlmN [Treponema sp.]
MSSPAGNRTALPPLSGLPLEELTTALIPLPAYRARQIFKWISRGIADFTEMKNLPRSLREELAGRFTVYSSAVSAELPDPDGTVKLQIRLADGAKIEAVLLADGRERKTACLSTQAGCPAQCVFCKTGQLGFKRNLSSSEIVEQFLFLRRIESAISNIVVMGMGEPLLNLAELRRAVSVLTCREGLGLSPRRITVSTCGIAGGIRDLADNGPRVRLAVSLTAAEENLRGRLMPISVSNPLPALKDSLRYYQEKGGGRVTLEAALFAGINTHAGAASAMAAFAHGLDAAINLIPWNPVAGLEFEGVPLREPAAKEVQEFSRLLEKDGLTVTRRYRKGRSISGACGQLGSIQ